MGYIRHHAILVTSFNREEIEKARVAALDCGLTVSEAIESPVNGYASFLIAPDGSKEGWAASDDGDKAREKFVGWLHSEAYSDGSSPYDWVEIQFGDDNGESKILCGSDDNAAKDAA